MMMHTIRNRSLPQILLTIGALLATSACGTKGGKAFNEGQAHLKKGHPGKAIASFERAIQQNPDFGEAHYNLGAARYRQATARLRKAVAEHGSPALKQALAATRPTPASPKKRAAPGAQGQATKLASGQVSVEAMAAELAKIPAAAADPIVKLLQGSLKAKLKARALFQRGKFVVVKKARKRRAMLAKLDRVVRLDARLRKAGPSRRGLWLLAVARPTLLTPPEGKAK